MNVRRMRTENGTLIFRIPPDQVSSPEAAALLSEAAALLRSGETVVFPTETVYGLGAVASSPEAVRKIFAAKGRPGDNPLIVHIWEPEQLFAVGTRVPDTGAVLARHFWPGPLTLVVPVGPDIVPEVTAGLSTVGVRLPAHPVALALLRQVGMPVAAPSANLSWRPSPTTAEHAVHDLDGRVAAIIDSGPTAVGLESTVLDITLSPPTVLRPGGITREELEDLLGMGIAEQLSAPPGQKPRSPGQKYTHYKPKAQVRMVQGTAEIRLAGNPGPGAVAGAKRVAAPDFAPLAQAVWDRCVRERRRSQHPAILATEETLPYYWACGARWESMPPVFTGPLVPAGAGKELEGVWLFNLGSRADLHQIAAHLYTCLRLLDAVDATVAFAEQVPAQGIGAAVMNRLRRACGGLVWDPLAGSESEAGFPGF